MVTQLLYMFKWFSKSLVLCACRSACVIWTVSVTVARWTVMVAMFLWWLRGSRSLWSPACKTQWYAIHRNTIYGQCRSTSLSLQSVEQWRSNQIKTIKSKYRCPNRAAKQSSDQSTHQHIDPLIKQETNERTNQYITHIIYKSLKINKSNQIKPNQIRSNPTKKSSRSIAQWTIRWNPSAAQPVNKSLNQPTNQSISWSAYRSMDWSAKQQTSQPIHDQAISRPTNQSISQSTSRWIHLRINQVQPITIAEFHRIFQYLSGAWRSWRDRPNLLNSKCARWYVHMCIPPSKHL